MSEKELMILRLLIDNPRGLYGSDFVQLSQGVLGRGSIYTMLDRMIAKGYVNEAQEAPEEAGLTPRTRHMVSAAGHRAYRMFLKVHGLSRTKRFTLGTAMRSIAVFILAEMPLLPAQAGVTFDLEKLGWGGFLFPLVITVITVIVTIFTWTVERRLSSHLQTLRSRPRKVASPCGRLRSLCDWIPGPILRARVLKLVADQERHIKKLRSEKRFWAARWNLWGTAAIAIYLVIVATALVILEFIVRRQSK